MLLTGLRSRRRRRRREEDVNPEVVDVVAPSNISSADTSLFTMTRNPDDVPNRNTAGLDLNRESKIFRRGNTHADGKRSVLGGKKKSRSPSLAPFMGIHHSVPNFKVTNTFTSVNGTDHVVIDGNGVDTTVDETVGGGEGGKYGEGGGYGAGRTDIHTVEKREACDHPDVVQVPAEEKVGRDVELEE